MEAKTMPSSDGDSRIKKKAQGTRSSSDSPMPDKASFASTPAATEVGKGKVMDFVKNFSQGASVVAGGESLRQSSRWRAKEIHVTDIKKDGANAKETNIPDQQKKPIPDIQAMTLGCDSLITCNNKASGVTEQEKREEPSKTHINTTADIDEAFHVNFLVEDITLNEKKLGETQNNAEDIQIIDAKIRKWSSGKSGNIRSLLSTLQYILWPGSGWKAVPLMDMIEGKRSSKIVPEGHY
ncbi:hypothetical protein DY000_02062404 [Brassica cretica]|uniref:Uncharacterized protein n=1 Tax=Brassica cretica TaxID=69181 RepID=A0ABQ7B3T5_BRACR|nr:hypothetical protein DY000_02062404 [Brassica cretica]